MIGLLFYNNTAGVNMKGVTLQNILSKLRKAVTEYNLISEGDSIAVGISGGKDSLTLLTALQAYQKFSPQSFSLKAICVDLGFKSKSEEEMRNIELYCQKLGVPLTVISTEISAIIFEHRQEKSPCSLCAKMRRGALCSAAKELGCNKVALGHHADDLTETLMLSMIYEGRLSTFLPKSYMDRTKVTVIRPLIYAEEKEIRSFAKNLPVMFNPCPVDKHTQREYIKTMLANLQKDIPFAKKRIFSAIISPKRYNLFDKIDTQQGKIDT